MSNCIFCRIVQGEAPAHIVHENAYVVAFLDRWPIGVGHVQVATRLHVPYFEDVPEDAMAAITAVGQLLAKRMKRLYGVQRVAFAFTGGDVAHTHAHVVPMRLKGDITSARYIVEQNLTFRSTPQMLDDELAAVAEALRVA